MSTAPANETVHYHRGTGRRKTAVARVRIKPGQGSITVNGKKYEEYFPIERERMAVRSPLLATQSEARFDIIAKCHGGGVCAQAGAVLLGIARALLVADPALEVTLRAGGFLTRDSRMKERKKYGQKSARAQFQFSKR